MAPTIAKARHFHGGSTAFARPVAGTVASIALLLTAHCKAAEWTVTPSLEIAHTYTDNLRLAAAGAEVSDFVTEVSPGLALNGTGRGLKVKASYVMQNFAYADQSSKLNTNHQLQAAASAELVDHLFFLDGTASLRQQNISPFGRQAASNLNLTNNRTDVRTYSISPYLRHRFNSIAHAELRYTHDETDTSTGALLGAQSDRLLMAVKSGPAFRSLGWGVQLSNQKLRYTNATSIDMENYSGNLQYLVSPRFSLTATGGYERNNYFSIGEKPEGAFWTAGFAWAPTERTHISASAGKRFYGSTFALATSHRTRHTVWSVNYDEDITTTQSQFLVPVTINTSDFLNQLWKTSIPDADKRQQAIDAFIRDTGVPLSLSRAVNTFSNRVFLQKKLQASVAVNGAKNTVLFNLFNLQRDAQTGSVADAGLLASAGGTLDDRTRQTGGSVVWNWRMSPRTSVNINVGRTRVEALSSARKENNKTTRLMLVRQLQPKLKGALELRRIQQNSNQSGNNYRENAVTASLLMSF